MKGLKKLEKQLIDKKLFLQRANLLILLVLLNEQVNEKGFETNF
jgi:hypothetical protein